MRKFEKFSDGGPKLRLNDPFCENIEFPRPSALRVSAIVAQGRPELWLYPGSMGYLGLCLCVALNCKKPASSECRGKRKGSSLFDFVLIYRFVATMCAPMNIDPSRKDIEDWNKCVEDQAQLGPDEG